MATFWEIATRSANNLFSLYFVYLKYLFISRFGFKSGICLFIAPVPVHCFSITFKFNRDYIVVLVTCKNKEDPIKNEGARVLTSFLFDFSDAQGQLTPKSVVEFCRHSTSSKRLWLSLLPA